MFLLRLRNFENIFHPPKNTNILKDKFLSSLVWEIVNRKVMVYLKISGQKATRDYFVSKKIEHGHDTFNNCKLNWEGYLERKTPRTLRCKKAWKFEFAKIWNYLQKDREIRSDLKQDSFRCNVTRSFYFILLCSVWSLRCM